jgi:hypothetical protein
VTVPVLPFRLSVLDHAGASQDWVGAPLSVAATIRVEPASDVTITLDADDPQVDVLTAPGSRLVVEYLADPLSGTWVHLASGLVGERSGTSGTAPTRTFSLVEARTVVLGLVSVPSPTLPIDAQTAEYRTVTGPAETVLKTLVAENAAWCGLPVTVATDHGRGDTITAKIRFAHLSDLLPQLSDAGLVVDARVSGGGWWLDVREPDTWPDVLTQASGVVQPGSWKMLPPTVTRAVVLGGPGEGVARPAAQVLDGTGLESAWGVVLPSVIDASQATSAPLMTSSGNLLLGAGRPTAQVSAQLSETDDFRAWVTFVPGDTVQVQLVGAPVIAAQVTEIAVTWDTSNGLLVVPHVGDVNVSSQAIMTTAISTLAASVARQGRK